MMPHATPRHATPRHATPRHATPRHATPRHATSFFYDFLGRVLDPPLRANWWVAILRVVILLIVVYGMMPSAFAAFDISKSGDLTATEFDEVGFDTTGLVGYWQLNGNANDSSGQGNNGTIVGATATTDRFGTANMAMSFNGSNNYIAVASPSGLPTGTSPRTLALWFKKSNNTVWSKEVVGYGTNGSIYHMKCDIGGSIQLTVICLKSQNINTFH